MSKALPLMVLLLSGICIGVPMQAQTATYTSNTPFHCDMESAYPLTSFNQFSCRGMNYYDATGNWLAEQFFQVNVGNRYLLDSASTENDTNWGSITDVTSFTRSTCTSWIGNGVCSVANFAFTWTLTDSNGVVHTGTTSGTWKNLHVCGGRGCSWWAPEILTSSVTVN